MCIVTLGSGVIITGVEDGGINFIPCDSIERGLLKACNCFPPDFPCTLFFADPNLYSFTLIKTRSECNFRVLLGDHPERDLGDP